MATDMELKFWGKKNDSENHYPLLFHMLDVAAVTQELWDNSLHASTRNFVTKETGLSETEARKWISFWTGLHDIGKASPSFQSKSLLAKGHLVECGFPFVQTKEVPHGTVTTCVTPGLMEAMVGKEMARKIAVVIGGHHGIFPRSEDVLEAGQNAGNPRWDEARQTLFDKMVQLCNIKPEPLLASSSSPAFCMFLAGLTSVADWIASNDTYFPYEINHGIEGHLSYAHKKANEALDKLGWIGWQPPSVPAQIGQLFPTIQEKGTRPLQEEAIALAQTLRDHPALVIIEAPMGEGKTEAAIYLADSWGQALGQRGCYFALPTMATSNQMFGRVKGYLENRYHDERVNLMLLHGHAALSTEFEVLKKRFASFSLSDISGSRGYDGAAAEVVASEWFTYRKRGLLAPFGVGTIDQVLLGVLQTRHVFVRLFGMANKTIIIDEIHAYDAYMTTLLERLLEWLAALGSSVVMLSATLPRRRRDALLKAYVKGLTKGDRHIPVELDAIRYPRISWAVDGEFKAKSIPPPFYAAKELHLQWVNGNVPRENGEFELGSQLREALSDGGYAAVVCNTVDRAQKVYLALKPYFPGKADDGEPELDLLHARYLYGDREAREERSLRRFGKNGKDRQGRAVLVATQIIEQSLDIDFDLMVTEMAPVDLILQRSGRMHRHQDRERPDRLKEPTVWICRPEMEESVPSFGGGTEAVYDYHVLLRSWLAIKDKNAIKIPEEVEILIEEVYGEQECPANLTGEIRKKWVESREKLKRDIENEKEEAKERWIKWPGYSQEIWRISSEPREEDNPELHKAHQALTRLTGLTVNVLCLYGEKAQSYLDTALSQPIDTAVFPNTELTRELLMRAVPISRQGLVERIIADGQHIPSAWREEVLLRHHYILFFDESNRCQFDKYALILDEEKGLVIEKTV